ncbi:FAD binding oxidoreductase, implicated in cellular detoxification [Schizosaccharomyces pombe]|uniref:Uncharacterized protein C5H10.05c n=1 Tax=Schizosaccharomyces pombe (strain 972 / ATCC 24843) TaxID=284812 RepID=YA05_SCHPO|nr:putative FAD binding oxidoreductase [Schizosaccharomyces pombe]Q09677.1 RecName: Full=Uncharacterized protein C5H10.05c [Schizosaccharomyces pombe 972h-]CAA89955.1 FAD binding oxidoreductase (predicted) [Schizosaccharomyces pombe]|eukprot:NP_592818.1 putative FAD binding oxidoreductase [Schizosaccharomyces pombe]
MKILLINGAQEFAHSQGKFNKTLHNVAKDTLIQLGHTVQETVVDEGYDENTEVEKILWANVIIYQWPGWWMGTPWKLKRYMDEVFTAGYGQLYANDGRSSKNPTQNYGKGGLLHEHRYMISCTWNAPAAAFEEVGNFFDGRGVDGTLLTFHKANQFLGMKPLPTFMVNDVIKNPKVDIAVCAYKDHLNDVFGSANA